MNPDSVPNSTAGLPLWQRYADQFPVRERLAYLNHAAVAPLSKPAADAMKRLADDCLAFGSLHYGEWLAAYEGLRVAAARLMGADRSEIAFVKNTSEGIATVAMGLDWKPGDRMVGFREEFPANYFPWKRLEQKGIEVTCSPSRTPWTGSTKPPRAHGSWPSVSCNSSADGVLPFKRLVRFAIVTDAFI